MLTFLLTLFMQYNDDDDDDDDGDTRHRSVETRHLYWM